MRQNLEKDVRAFCIAEHLRHRQLNEHAAGNDHGHCKQSLADSREKMDFVHDLLQS